MEKEELITANQFAELHGLTKQAVHLAIREGRIKSRSTSRPVMLHPTESLVEWNEHTSQKQQRKRKPNGIGNAEFVKEMKIRGISIQKERDIKALDDKIAGVEGFEEEDGLMSFVAAERLEKVYKAKMARLKFEEAEGLLVPIESVAKTVEQEYNRVRTALQSMGAKLAADLARASTEAEAKHIVDEAVDEVLTHLSKYNG